MLLMIDNYDSFTYNLVQYFSELGQRVVIKRNDEIDVKAIEELSPNYIVVSPGPCTPNEAGISKEAIAYFAGKIPLLGVCLGHQCIAEVFGAQVVRANCVMHGKTSVLTHCNVGVFKDLPNPLMVTRYHSLTVKPSTLPEMLDVTAWMEEDGAQVIMGIRHKNLAVEGVQFHPESFMTEAGHELLANFLNISNAVYEG